MHFINPESAHIKEALEIHKDELLPVLVDRISECKIEELQIFLKKEIPDILIGKPFELVNIQKKLFEENDGLEQFLNEKRNTANYDKHFRKIYSPYLCEMERIFNYKSFSTKSKNNFYDASKL